MKTEDQTVAEAMQYYYDRHKEELEKMIRKLYRAGVPVVHAPVDGPSSADAILRELVDLGKRYEGTNFWATNVAWQQKWQAAWKRAKEHVSGVGEVPRG